MVVFDFQLLIFIAPALILGVVAKIMVQSAFSQTSRIAARLSGYAAARRMLDSAGLFDVQIEQVPGTLSDHYDPRHKVLRLSADVYHGRSMAAVGVAAHEAGHAIQDAKRYFPLMIRNVAVPAASFGSTAGMLLLVLGLLISSLGMLFGNVLLLLGIVLFSGVVFFQIINLPVEFNASTRAKAQLVELGVIDQSELPWVNKVLTAAALTYVAATLQAILTLLYYILQFTGRRD